MVEEVETRSYHSPRRAQQAAETRAAVLRAATDLFSEHGWGATAMRDVAEAAGVSVETVYAAYGSKSGLLLAAVEVGVVGDLDPVALADRPEFAALGAGPGAERAAALARLATEIHRRTAALGLALREAATTDDDAAARLQTLEEQRRTDLGRALDLVAGRRLNGQEQDGLWAIGAAEVYRLLTETCGWTDRQYETWIADLLVRLLEPKDET